MNSQQISGINEIRIGQNLPQIQQKYLHIDSPEKGTEKLMAQAGWANYNDFYIEMPGINEITRNSGANSGLTNRYASFQDRKFFEVNGEYPPDPTFIAYA